MFSICEVRLITGLRAVISKGLPICMWAYCMFTFRRKGGSGEVYFRYFKGHLYPYILFIFLKIVLRKVLLASRCFIVLSKYYNFCFKNYNLRDFELQVTKIYVEV